MSNSRTAIRYAKAILDIATSKGVAQDVNKDMLSIGSTIRGNGELHDFIQHPTIKVELKESVLKEVFSEINPETKRLLGLLLNNRRFEILEQITKEYNLLFEKQSNIDIVKVTTAFPITSDIEVKILAKIKEFSDKTILIKNIIDPSIIGGFILRIGDKEYNSSIANRLQILKREFSN